MPNWCTNSLTVTTKDSEKKTLVELKAFYHENRGRVDSRSQDLVFNSGVPVPKNLSGEEAYNYRVNNWGTKWEPYDVNFQDNGNELFYSFDTAWAPPVPWLEKISTFYPNLIFKMDFEEPGMGIYGGVNIIDGDVEEYENDQTGNEEDEITPEEAFDLLDSGDQVMVFGWDSNEPRLYAGVTIDDFEGQGKDDIIKSLSEYDSLQFWG